MVSTKGAALATSVIALLGVCIQLGSLAAWTNYGCRSDAGAFQPLTTTVTATGRRLAAAASSSENKARCSMTLGAEWWTVFYQLAIAIASIIVARGDDVLLRTRTRVGILYAIAIVWVVLLVNRIVIGTGVGSPITLQNALRDAEISEKDYKDLAGEVQYGLYTSMRAFCAGGVISAISYFLYTSMRAFCAGGVISAISYFLYIVLALSEDEVPAAKEAEVTTEAATA